MSKYYRLLEPNEKQPNRSPFCPVEVDDMPEVQAAIEKAVEQDRKENLSFLELDYIKKIRAARASENPVQVAEPVTIVSKGYASDVGRTVGSSPATGAARASEPWKVVPVKRQSGEVWTGLGNIDCGGGRLLGSMNEQVALAVVAAHNGREIDHEE